MLIGSTASWRLAERTPSIVQADRLARALGTSVAKMCHPALSQRTPCVPNVEVTHIPVTGDGKFGPVAGWHSNSPVRYDSTDHGAPPNATGSSGKGRRNVTPVDTPMVRRWGRGVSERACLVYVRNTFAMQLFGL